MVQNVDKFQKTVKILVAEVNCAIIVEIRGNRRFRGNRGIGVTVRVRVGSDLGLLLGLELALGLGPITYFIVFCNFSL